MASQESFGLEGFVYRAVAPRWAHPNYLINGEGGFKHPGRWIAARVARMVYASFAESTALKESRGNLKFYRISQPVPQPRTLVCIGIRLQQCIEISRTNLSQIGLTADEILDEDWRSQSGRGQPCLSQWIGQCAFEAPVEAVVVPSAVDGRAKNLLWFPENLLASSKVWISGEEELRQWIRP